MRIGLIVEGHGEVAAAPVLISRVATYLDPGHEIVVLSPHRLTRGEMRKEAKLRRTVEFTARRLGPGEPILVLLDADVEPACERGPRLLAWARAARSDREIGVVAAVREYEAWFLAAGRSLAGLRGLPALLEPPMDPESVRSPKGWLNREMAAGYAETLDQKPLTRAMDLAAARSAPSFDKLVRDVARLLRLPATGAPGD